MKESEFKKQSSEDDSILNTVQIAQSEIKQLCNKNDKTKTTMTELIKKKHYIGGKWKMSHYHLRDGTKE